jgi:hypothetical protein
MIAEPNNQPDAKSSAGGSGSSAVLAEFLANNPGARAAAKSLRAGAEVAITLGDSRAEWRAFASAPGQLSFEPVKATDPDIELLIPPRAVQSLCDSSIVDVGELAVAFFEHIVSSQQELKIRVTVRSGLIKLTRRGWLGVISQGGPKIMMWLATKGLHGPGAITAALRKFGG